MSVDAGFNVDIATSQNRPAVKPAKGKKNKYVPQTFEDFYKRYAFVANAIASDPTGSLQQFYTEILDYANKNRGQMPPATWIKEKKADNAWFQARNANQAEFDLAMQDPALKREVETALSLNKDKILSWAADRGIEIPPERIDDLALDATRNKWADDSVQLEKNLNIFLREQVKAGGDVRGTAGDFQTQLLNWSRKNGITLSNDAAAQFVERMSTGAQTLEDAKREIRETYMVGAYPAWADQIRNGLDPDSIVSPYRSAAAQLLEIPEDQLGWNDPILQKAMQGVSADGKPSIVPLWEYEQEVRKDPRWQKTDNAYQTYTNVGQDLLRMFGFR